MKNAALFTAILAGMLTASTAMAGGTLSIRLVEASNSGSGGAAGLGDVIDVLKSNVPGYSQFTLIASGSKSLPADGSSIVVGKYQIMCKGNQKELSIEVSSGHKHLLSVTASLRDGIPVIFGGLPSDKGKHVLVFVAQ